MAHIAVLHLHDAQTTLHSVIVFHLHNTPHTIHVYTSKSNSFFIIRIFMDIYKEDNGPLSSLFKLGAAFNGSNIRSTVLCKDFNGRLEHVRSMIVYQQSYPTTFLKKLTLVCRYLLVHPRCLSLLQSWCLDVSLAG